MPITPMMKRIFKLSAIICGLVAAMAFAAPAQLRPTKPPNVTAPQELRGSVFVVEADGKKMGTFHRISTGSPLGTGSQSRQSHNLNKNPSPMILSGGDAASMQAFEMWRQQAANGKPDSARHTVIILCKDALGNTVARYKLTHAWPIRLTTGGGAAGKDSAGTTTVELAYEEMEIVH